MVLFRTDYYRMLGVAPTADFDVLKKAYYQRAKECHPDRFPGRKDKEEEFKLLVEAFDTLSDPVTRGQFDRMRQQSETTGSNGLRFAANPDRTAVMDTAADDTLEELIVGNTIPTDSHLQTLLLDLEQTERFCRYREAKTALFQGRSRQAAALFRHAVADAPNNILCRFFLARALVRLDQPRMAIAQLEIALQLGALRSPPQHLTRIRQELDALRKAHGGFLGRWSSRRERCDRQIAMSPEEELRQAFARALANWQREGRGIPNSRALPAASGEAQPKQ